MSIERTKSKQKVKEPKTKITWKEIKRQKVLLFWAAIMVVYGVVFYYLPLAGWAMAFQNYKARLGIFHSEFVGLDKFRTLFSDMTFIRVIRNTLAMGVINLVVTFVTAIVFAILLNEIKTKGILSRSRSISLLIRVISGQSLHLPMSGKKQDGMQLFIWQQLLRSIHRFMKRQLLTVPADGQKLSMLHFRVLNQPLSFFC